MNDYRLESRLGAGGMAEVTRATMTSAGGFTRKVAIKRLLPHLAEDESAIRMFLDEARIASKLHHAAIVSVLDYGVLDGLPFQVLELVDGEDLRKLRARSEPGIPIPVVLHALHEVALALAYAHDLQDEGRPLGIVHRDVSPSNILIGWNGDVKLTDFGIAFANDNAEKTRTGVMKGKLAYMAPEQALGGAVDPRTDVFGLGCTLHAALTGSSPTADETAFASLLAGTPTEPSAALDDDLKEIVRRAIAPARSARYVSMRELAQALATAFAARDSRLGRDVLLEWLASVRTTSAQIRSGRGLDVLLGLDLVPVEEQNGVRTYVTKAAAEKIGPEPTVVEARPARSRAPWIAGVMVLAASGAGLWVASRGQPASVEPTPTAVEPAATVAPITTADSPRSSASATLPLPPISASSAASSIVLAPSSASAARAHPPRSTSAQPDTSQSIESAATAGTGYLVVAGERVHGYSVFIDGRAVGAAPTPAVPVSVGAHSVKLVKGAETMGPYSVSVAPANATPAKALRFRP